MKSSAVNPREAGVQVDSRTLAGPENLPEGQAELFDAHAVWSFVRSSILFGDAGRVRDVKGALAAWVDSSLLSELIFPHDESNIKPEAKRKLRIQYLPTFRDKILPGFFPNGVKNKDYIKVKPFINAMRQQGRRQKSSI